MPNKSETVTDDRAFKIAVISTTYYLRSHSDVITTRWTTRRPHDKDWGWPGPSSELASIYIEQIRDTDTGVAWAKENHIPLMANVEQAMTLGGDTLAVDGVLLIGEHGVYSKNEYDQKMYPRKALFDKIVEVFKKYGKVLPVFCDKHYSYDATWAHEMVASAQSMGFPLLGGSSIPHTPLVPKCDLQAGYKPARAVAVYYGDKEAYLYHSLELAQSILEKRAGGESGIQSVTTWQGPEVWEILDTRFGNDLLHAAIKPATPAKDRKSDNMAVNCAAWRDSQGDQRSPTLAIVQYADGLEVAHVNLNGHIEDWSLAIQTTNGDIHPIGSTAAGEDLWYAHFATFSKLVETFLKTGEYPFAPQRALLTTCATAAIMHAAQHMGRKYDSPLTNIPYKPMTDHKYHPGA